MSDTRGRCSYCYTDAGRDKVKACSECRVVRYCSKECQRKAWPAHKKCCSGEVYKDLEDDPTGAALLSALNKWTQEWRDAIQIWSLWAFNLPNQPEDYVSEHIFVFELERRRNAGTRKKQFHMLGGEVMTRKKVLSILTEMKCPPRNIENFKTDRRGNSTVQTLIIAEGMVKFLWYGQRDAITGEEVPLPMENPDQANLFAEYWEPAMIDTIGKGDPSLTREYPKTVALNLVPGLRAIVSIPRSDSSGPGQVIVAKK
ncbi:hypothetical protein FPV67DRAFT_1036365 [Lyophyllum atratum]|nr:hypothetical protein FPV67DRAFT_1036365 [Lyophyllum atratum]